MLFLFVSESAMLTPYLINEFYAARKTPKNDTFSEGAIVAPPVTQ